jgi:hypothetical protein
VVLFFFQKKKQKAFALLRREIPDPTLGEADPGGFESVYFLFFQKEKALNDFGKNKY